MKEELLRMKKRLDVQVIEERYDYIKEVSEKTGTPMNVIADELLAIGIAVKRGEVIEQQSLPIIREIVHTELQKQLAQQRQAFREDLNIELTQEIKALHRASDNRLAALIVRGIRDASIAWRLAYAQLYRAYGDTFARTTYEDARSKAGAELARKGNGEG